MNKKAALNLGISTVVVMVIAMVVIGAGVSFIRTMFGDSTEALIGTFDLVGGVGLNPTRDEQLVLELRSVEMEGDDSRAITAGFYNREVEEVTVNLTIGSCQPSVRKQTGGILKDPSTAGPPFNITIQSVQTAVPGRGSVGFTFLLQTQNMTNLEDNEGDKVNNFICSIRVSEIEGVNVRTISSRQIRVTTPA